MRQISRMYRGSIEIWNGEGAKFISEKNTTIILLYITANIIDTT